jgi:hypothetical protein
MNTPAATARIAISIGRPAKPASSEISPVRISQMLSEAYRCSS